MINGGDGEIQNLVLALILISLSPLAEQHRIVAKADELMKICDQLKDELQQS